MGLSVKIKKDDGVKSPAYETSGSAGMDLRACIQTPITIESGKFSLIPTGLSFEIPSGFEAQVRPRSGLAAKSGVTVLNAPGTIDSDYRGEVKVILINLGGESFTVQNGDRIAQIVFSSVTQVCLQECKSLAGSARSDGGFGSTGIQ
ncbi:MAG: dUTP diphosphatase [Termitinemataceae bacterium]|nr:MAG: dUTP diphosphatase [Termitinemataceae bacterium]